MKVHFTSQAQLALNYAKEAAKECRNNYIGTEHLLLGILRIEEARLTRIMKEVNVDYDSLLQEVNALFGFSQNDEGPVEYTCTMDDILQRCFFLSCANDNKLIDLDCLSLCLLEAENNVANELLRRNGVAIEEIMKRMRETQMDVLNRFKELRNLNEIQKKNPTPIAGREKELNGIMDTLMRKIKANPLLVGEAGVGKSAIVEELARRIVNKEVPEALEDCIIVELSLNSLVAGTKYRGEFEEKIQKLLDTLRKLPQVILFIDEIHMMINAGKAEGSIDVAGVLKPYLARGSLRCIGATTMDEYNRSIEKDRALKRRFQLIRIDEPSYEETRRMLLMKKAEYERHHEVVFPESLIELCLFVCAQYLPSLTFPDKAIDVMDLSCVKAKMNNKKTVSRDILLKAAESMSQIPFSLKEILSRKKKKLKEYLDDEQIEAVLNRLGQIDQHKNTGPLDVWMLNGDKQPRQLADCLTEILLNQAGQLIVLNSAFLGKEELILLSERLKKNPFQIIYIDEKETSVLKNQGWIKEVLTEGKLQVVDQVLDFRFCLFLIHQHKAARSVGFVKTSQVKEQEEFVLKLHLPAMEKE